VLVAKAKGGQSGGSVRLWRAASGGSSSLLLLGGGEPPTRPRTRAERARVLSVLEHHPYFQGLGKQGKEAALGQFFAVHVSKGELVLAQGARGDNLYILDSGRAEIVRRKGPPGATPVVVAAAVNPGSVFGEAAVLFDSKRGASVRALEDCRLWALGRVDAMALTGRGPPFTLLKAGEERYMTHDDFCRALYPPGPSQSQSQSQQQHEHDDKKPPIRLLLRALDPTCVRVPVFLSDFTSYPWLTHLHISTTPHPCIHACRGRGLISFSELVHLDVWMNSAQAPLEAALRLAGRDAGFEALTLADWAALRDAARRDSGSGSGSSAEAEDEQEDARFVARTFGAAGGRQWRGRRRGRSLLSAFGVGGSKDEREKETAKEGPEPEALAASVPYDDFVRALESPGKCVSDLTKLLWPQHPTILTTNNERIHHSPHHL
jgi:hypothetical protein